VFTLCESLEYLVFCDKISSHWVKEVPMNEGVKRGTLLKRALFYHYWLV